MRFLKLHFGLYVGLATATAPVRLAPLLEGHTMSTISDLNEKIIEAPLQFLNDVVLTIERVVSHISFDDMAVEWKPVSSPADNDIIAISCLQLDSEQLRDIGIIDFVNASSSSTWASGHGRITFRLPEISCDQLNVSYLQFTARGILIRAEEPILRTLDSGKTSPYHLRIALSDAPGEVYISWTSRANASVGMPLVLLGTSPTNMTLATPVSVETLTYTAADMCRYAPPPPSP
jgi:hypothetical protein